LPEEIRHALAEAVGELSIPGRRVPPSNWHITLRFLGFIDETVFERFLNGLGDMETQGAFRVGLSGLGAFPNPRRAAVVWAGIGRGVDALTHLAEMTEEAAGRAGVAPEERPFHPHLTLSRVRPPEDVTDLMTSQGPLLDWVCDRVIVYESKHGKGGAVYEPLETFLLRR
jgi:2'-5' RNA ligase